MWDGNTHARMPVHTKSNEQRRQLAGKIGHIDDQNVGDNNSNSSHARNVDERTSDYRTGTLSGVGLAGFLNAADQPVFSTKHQPKKVLNSNPPKFHPPSSEQLRKMNPHLDQFGAELEGDVGGGGGGGGGGDGSAPRATTGPLAPENISPIRHAGRQAAMSSAGVSEAIFGGGGGPAPSALSPYSNNNNRRSSEQLIHGRDNLTPAKSSSDIHLPQLSQQQRRGASQTPEATRSSTDGGGFFFDQQQQQQAVLRSHSRTPGGNRNSQEEVGLLPFQKPGTSESALRRQQLDPLPVAPTPTPSLPLHLQHVQRSQERRANGANINAEENNMVLPFQNANQHATPSKFASRFPSGVNNSGGGGAVASPNTNNTNNSSGTMQPRLASLPSRTDQLFGELVALVWQNNAEASHSQLQFNPGNPFPDMKIEAAALSAFDVSKVAQLEQQQQQLLQQNSELSILSGGGGGGRP